MSNEAMSQDISGHRTLAAIVFTDGVDFSARMSVDEIRTLELIRRDLNFMREQCALFQGRVLKSTGDGLLMYFASAREAVQCTLEIQQTFRRASASLRPRDVLSHRIGIHLGDVFISETDAMGNGVNIAARLQTEAEPGTICVSQTVYDVVRSGLELDAVYLGVRELKNIREAVPIYQIRPMSTDSAITPPQPISSSSDTQFTAQDSPHDFGDHRSADEYEDSSSMFLEPSKEIFDQVVQQLEQDPNLTRIKKIIFYACLNTWENDLAKLNKINLKGLIQELIEVTPRLEHLKSLLQGIVYSTSKPDVYAHIVETIINQVQRLYPEDQLNLSYDIYDRIVADLEKSEHIGRIKKLVVYICRQTWENDQNVLDSLNFKQLLKELHAANPILENLRTSLGEVIKTISKQAEYNLIANVLLTQLQVLYPQQELVQTLKTPSPPIVHSISERSESRDNVEQVSSDRPDQSTPDPVFESNRSFQHKSQRNEQIAEVNLFDLRLEIIKYISPLRAKNLIYTVLDRHAIANDLSVVKTHELDNLLRDLFYTYANFADMETALWNTADQLDDSEQYAQAANVITKAAKTLSNLWAEV